MATNKHATIRYNTLDQCFSNPGRRYYIEDLIEACNTSLFEFTGTSDGIRRRQIYDDIRFMESEQGWSIPLEKKKDGRKVYYRYSDRTFSIKKRALNESEVTQLKETLLILNRFKGMPQFEWMEELLIRIESEFKLKSTAKAIVSFEQNPFLKGLEYFTDLFNAIHYRKVLEVSYKSFKHDKPAIHIIHPYYLKQYNNRWFLFGRNDEYNNISNLAIDRILAIQETSKKYIENNQIDFDEYFEDIIGVTVLNETKPETISLRIDNELFPYIENKPIHGSQKVKNRTEDYSEIELYLQINYEFTSLLFSFGEKITVIGPEHLKEMVLDKADKMIKNYI